MKRLAPILLLILFLLLTGTASAMSTFESGDTITIDRNVDNDLYIAGGDILISGDVNGDLFAAGGLIEVRGNVSGDVMVAAGEVIIKGNVGDDGRIVSGKTAVYGNIEDDMMIAGSEVLTSANTTIGGDLLCSGNEMIILSTVKGDLEAKGDNLRMGGNILGDALIDVREYTEMSGARIEGNLTSETQKLQEQTDSRDKKEQSGLSFLTILLKAMEYLFLLTIGVISILLLPKLTSDIAARIQKAPLTCMGAGLLSTIGAIFGAIVLMITVIGIPLGLLLLLILIFLLFIAKIYTGLWIGQWLSRRSGKEYTPWKELALGLFILLMLTWIPWIGGLISAVATLLGIGGFYLALKP